MTDLNDIVNALNYNNTVTVILIGRDYNKWKGCKNSFGQSTVTNIEYLTRHNQQGRHHHLWY